MHSLTVCADNSGTYEAVATEDTIWWHETTLDKLFDLSELEGISTLAIDCSINFAVGYNIGDEWIQRDLASGAIVIDIATATLSEYSKVCAQPGSTDPYTITWTISGGAAAEAPAETPAETTAEVPAETPAVTPAPATGLALAVVPAVMALAAVAVTKRR